MKHAVVITVLLPCLLAACKPTPAPTAGSTAAAAPQTATAEGPNPAIDQPAPPPLAEEAVIATQPGMKDSQWSLTKVKVTGNLLTVQFTVRASQEQYLHASLPIDQINVIDDATAQRYSVVKDQSGQPMVSQAVSGNKEIGIDIPSKKMGVVWLKFPAPPATSSTVSISIPQVGAFDGVAIQR